MEAPTTSRPLRVLVVAECYLPSVNGVTNSVIRTVDHLRGLGHTVELMAPRSPASAPSGDRLGPEPAHRVRSVAVPRYRSLRVGLPTTGEIERVLRQFRPDVVHLAAPAVLGGRAVTVAERLGVPTVAVFQTDLAGFVVSYRGLSAAAEPIWRWLRRIHNRSDLTLAPTPTVARELGRRGFRPVEVWGRGVDLDQFDPGHRSAQLRAAWGLDGRLAVGFLGRLAAEKRVDRLAGLADHPGLRLVIIGDGPERRRLQGLLPDATFTGLLTGSELGQAVASLDLCVHTGEHETFCQAIQEAMASGVPVVAPAAGGPVDLIEPAVNGHLYRPGDDAALVATVERLVADPDARARSARAGLAAVQGRTWAAIGNQLVGHYHRVLAERATTRRSVRPCIGEAA